MSILLIAVYALLSVGVTKSTHYCFGRVQSVKYFAKSADNCFDSDERQMPCCDDELELLQLEDEQQLLQSLEISPTWFVINDIDLISELPQVSQLVTEISYNSNDPPGSYSQHPAYITFCSLTYYG